MSMLDSLLPDIGLRREDTPAPARTRPPGPARPSGERRVRPDALRILLLSSSLGSGHTHAARAIEVALRAQHHDIDIRTLDFWALMDDAVSASLHRAYLALVRHRPDLYDRIYMLDQGTWRATLHGAALPAPLLEGLAVLAKTARATLDEFPARAAHPLDRLMLRCFCSAWHRTSRLLPGSENLMRLAVIRSGWAILAHRLDAVLRSFAPAAVVSTQMNPAALLAMCGQRKRGALPSIGVITDFGVHDFWLQSGVDRYCLPHEDMALRPDPGRAEALVTGIPLMPRFGAPLSQAAARAQLGLAPDASVVLVAGGGLGIGVEPIANALLASPKGIHVLAVTGSNAEAARQLDAQAQQEGDRLRVWGWTDDMALLMHAADVVVGKPGGLTVAEALACGRPLLATHSLRAQEDFNVQFLQRHEVGGLVQATHLVPRIEALFAAPAMLAAVQARAWSLGKRDGATRIAALVLEAAVNRRETAGAG